MNPLLTPKRLIIGASIAGSLATGVAIGATTFSPGLVNAATNITSAASTTLPSPGDPGAAAPAMPAHGSQAHESAETPVTGANATKAQAAAVKAIGSGTAGVVTSDFTKNGYEVTVSKSDGTTVDVDLDSSFNVMQGHGRGGPGRTHDNDADDTSSQTATN